MIYYVHFHCEYALLSVMNCFEQLCVCAMKQCQGKENCLNIPSILPCEDVAVGLSLTGVTALCPRARPIYPSLVLVQSRKTRPEVTERLLNGT